MSLYQALQVGYALFVAGLIAERTRALFLRALTSEDAMRWIAGAIAAMHREELARWTELRPGTFVSRVLIASRAEPTSPGAVSECLLDLREEAALRLRLLRVCATLASTVGLLGGILALTRNAGSTTDLLRPGGVPGQELGEAIATMAIGVATSALCFQALALLRPAAQKAFMQAQQVARASAGDVQLR